MHFFLHSSAVSSLFLAYILMITEFSFTYLAFDANLRAIAWNGGNHVDMKANPTCLPY
jgi:hypothetical protein